MKKSLSTLILSFLLFGSATLNQSKGMEVRSLLDNDIANTVSGEIIRTKRAGESVDKEVSNDVKVQQRENADGTHDIRFVAGISSSDLSKAVFNVTISNGSKTASKSYDVTRAYTHIMVKENTLSAADVFGEGYDYLVAYAITGIPKTAIEYTYSVNVTINDDESILGSSDTRTVVLKEIVDLDNGGGSDAPVQKVDLSDNIISYNSSTTVSIDETVSHDGIQSMKVKGTNYDVNAYTQAAYRFSTPISGNDLNISFYVKLDGDNIYSNRITFRVYTTSKSSVDPQIYLHNTEHDKGVTVERVDNDWYKVSIDCNELEYNSKTLPEDSEIEYVRFTFEPADKKEETKVIEPVIWIDELTYGYGENNEGGPTVPSTPEVSKEDLSDKISHSSNTTISLDTEVNHDGVQSAKITGTPATSREDYSLAFYYGSATLTAETKIRFYAKLGDNIYSSRIAFRIMTNEGAKVTNNISLNKTNPVSGVTCTPDVDGWVLVEVSVAEYKDINDSTLTAVGGTLDYLRFGIIATDRSDETPTIVPIAWIDELTIA